MKILCPGIERFDVGGGATFLRNFQEAIKSFGHVCIADPKEEYDILFIAGASLCDREVVDDAVSRGKHIVLRVDNILEDKKNRNSGMPKMIEFAQKADVIIYQSEWAKKFLSPIIGDGTVIYNGVNNKIFFPGTPVPEKRKELSAPRNYVYSKFSRGEGKNVHVVIQWWREHHLQRPQDTITFIGRYAEDTLKVNHPFEFHNGEQWKYIPQISSPVELGDCLFRFDYAILPYHADACSNQILEAQACGLPVIYEPSGGTPEIIMYGEPLSYDMHQNRNRLTDRLDDIRESFNMVEFDYTFGLEKMARKYNGIFKLLEAGEQVIESEPEYYA